MKPGRGTYESQPQTNGISDKADGPADRVQRQLNKTNDQYADLLVELKRQKDLNKQARKDKYDNK